MSGILATDIRPLSRAPAWQPTVALPQVLGQSASMFIPPYRWGDAAVVGGRVPMSRIFADDARGVLRARVDAPFSRSMQFVREEISSEGQRVVVVRLNNRQRGLDDTPTLRFIILVSAP